MIYLIFNEGYVAPSGEALIRRELCSEAIRLGRVLCEIDAAEPESLGLLALMLLIIRVAMPASTERVCW